MRYNLEDKVVLITGASSGLGEALAYELARRGATLALASRGLAQLEHVAAVCKREGAGEARAYPLDVARATDGQRVVEAVQRDFGRIDVLINNAGVMTPPKRLETKDGFELQFGTNVLGHFALTGLLMPALEKAAAKATSEAERPRVVTIASIAHKRGQIRFDDLQWKKTYSPMGAYQQSKLGDLMFALELERRLAARDSSVMSLAAHPGVSQTNLFLTGAYGGAELAVRKVIGEVIGWLLNTDSEGALPTLYAATALGAVAGEYYGPQGFQEMRGEDVGEAKIAPQAKDAAVAAKLWGVCEELTGVRYLD